ncbi:putative membrane protein, partial [Chlamydia psittaci 02DC14]
SNISPCENLDLDNSVFNNLIIDFGSSTFISMLVLISFLAVGNFEVVLLVALVLVIFLVVSFLITGFATISFFKLAIFLASTFFVSFSTFVFFIILVLVMFYSFFFDSTISSLGFVSCSEVE